MMELKTLLLILLFPFVSASGTGADSLWLSLAPSLVMESMLKGTPGLQQMEQEQALGTWADMLIDGATDRQAVLQYCREKGIRRLVTGTSERQGDRVRFVVEVVDVDTGVVTPLAAEQGPLSGLIGTLGRMSAAVAAQLGVAAEPLTHLEAVLPVVELEAATHLELARLFLRQQNSELAYQEAAAYRRLKPADPAGARLAGESAYQLARFEEAIQAYSDLVKAQPDDVAARLALANALRGRGRLPEALRVYRETIGLQPDHAEAHLLQAQLLELLDMTRDAIAAYEAYLKMAPDTAQERPWRDKAEAALLSLRKRLR